MDNARDIASDNRSRLIAHLGMTDGRRLLAGLPTAVLEGGEGPPLVLLHGPAEFAATWMPVLGQLIRSHRVIAPDLPGHGASDMPAGGLDAALLGRWLDALIEQTCPSRPVVVGRVVGGAIAARFAVEHPDRLAHLVLVDSMGLAPFDPTPRFSLALHRYLAGPTATTFDRLMEFCTFDLDGVRRRLGTRWQPYAEYTVELAGTPTVQAAAGALIGQFSAPIPPEQLAGIDVPTTLIWGRDDLALPLQVAQAASENYGWPLHVIAEAGDDPPLDRPDAFLAALHTALGTSAPTAVLSSATRSD
jgi:pimeloyl-ACP methyl ester carboxylesterase